MPTIRLFVVFCISALLLSSCEVTKRHYLSGYSIKWNSNSKQKIANGDKKDTLTYAYTTDITTTSNDLAELPLTASAENAIDPSVISKAKSDPIMLPVEGECDILVFKNGTEVSGKVLEINPTEVKYKKCDNLNGPTIIVNKADVEKIKYANGTTEQLNDNEISIGSSDDSKVQEHDYYSPQSKHSTHTNDNKYKHKNRTSSGYYKPKINLFALSSMVTAILFGILALFGIIVLFYTPWLLLLLPIPIVLGIIGIREINANPEIYKGKWMAVFGIIFNGSTILIALLILALLLAIGI